ncbi:MAG: DUF393 domain-containing protein [Clostridia bacterium]|nr:DUF393 domain-containing protein [Deltaproteobacteria bacterium]
MMPGVPRIHVFYDGACPLCMREVRMLRRRDRKRHRIRFTDIAASDFDPHAWGKTKAEFMARIQAQLPDGRWIDGVEVFRQLYSAVGLGALLAITRVPGINYLAERVYDIFAKNRLRITGRDDACATDACNAPPRG